MEVKNNMPRFDSVDCDLGGWDGTQCGCGHEHVGGQRLRRRQLSHQSLLRVDVGADGEGLLSHDCACEVGMQSPISPWSD